MNIWNWKSVLGNFLPSKMKSILKYVSKWILRAREDALTEHLDLGTYYLLNKCYSFSCPSGQDVQLWLIINDLDVSYLLILMKEKKMVFLSSFYCGVGEIKRSVFCFIISMHFSCLSRAAVLYTPFLPAPPPHPNATWHAFTLKVKHISILFQEFQPTSGPSLEIYRMVPGPRWQVSLLASIHHHSILAPWSCLLILCLCSPLALPAWHSPNPVWHLLLRMGRGTQAGFQFFHELGAACNQQTVKPHSKASEVPNIVKWGTEPREVYKQRAQVESKLALGIESCWYKLLIFFFTPQVPLKSLCLLPHKQWSWMFICLLGKGLAFSLSQFLRLEVLSCPLSRSLLPPTPLGFSVFCV